jgi:hypothetical protein
LSQKQILRPFPILSVNQNVEVGELSKRQVSVGRGRERRPFERNALI